jgi:SHS2 domain-containing protein
MGRSETFDHTADLGLRVHAADLDDLFRTAALGLFDVIVANRQEVVEQDHEEFTLAADTAEALLIDWLNELIFRAGTGHRLFCRFDVHVPEHGLSLTATVFGEPIDPARHVLDHEVKAATRHGTRLVFENGEWQAEVILDI